MAEDFPRWSMDVRWINQRLVEQTVTGWRGNPPICLRQLTRNMGLVVGVLNACELSNTRKCVVNEHLFLHRTYKSPHGTLSSRTQLFLHLLTKTVLTQETIFPLKIESMSVPNAITIILTMNMS